MRADAASLGEAIRELLSRQAHGYEMLCALSRQQHEALRGNDSVLLNHLVIKKQRVVEQVERIQAALPQLCAAWEQVKPEASAALVQALRAAAAAVTRVLEQAMALEKENIALAQQQQQQVGRSLQDVRVGKSALTGYLESGRDPGLRHMDQRL